MLKGLDLSVNEGEHVLITGTGKTTLTRIIAGSTKLIYHGVLNGYAVNRVSLEGNVEAFASQVALIRQNPYLCFTESLVCHDLYNHALRAHGDVERATKALRKAVEVTGTQGLMKKYFFELSGG
ncbi:MAG: ATP-binding cassette domain-containing protein [Candidatus Nezhaarchaeales archaeon]